MDNRVFAEMTEELRKWTKRRLRAEVDRLEEKPDPEDFEKLFQEAIQFGWREVDSMAEGRVEEADRLFNHLFFTLGEETLAGSLGLGIACDLLAKRILHEANQRSDNGSFTFPLFMEQDFIGDSVRVESLRGEIHLSGELRMIPRANSADEVVCLLPKEKIGLRIPLKEVSIKEPVLTLGLRSCSMYDVALDQVRVPSFSISECTERALTSARGWVLALTAGIFSGGLRSAIDYAKERYQGGDVIFKHTGLQNVLSGLQTTLWRVEAVIQRNERIAQEERQSSWAVRQNFADAMESLATKAEDIIQIFGGYGYMEDFRVERVFRDVTHLAVSFGRRGFDRTVWPRGGEE